MKRFHRYLGRQRPLAVEGSAFAWRDLESIDSTVVVHLVLCSRRRRHHAYSVSLKGSRLILPIMRKGVKC
jgi:hypothetical protein